jgi:phosphoglycerate dehydrogenase-like enzyme
MTERILVTMAASPSSIERLLSEVTPRNEVRVVRIGQVRDEDLAWATIILGNIAPPSRLQEFPNIRWIHSPNVGLDMYRDLLTTMSSLSATNSRGVMDDAVGEHGLALLLALSRKIPQLVNATSRKEWCRDAYMREPESTVWAGKQIHVLGYGAIARAFIRKVSGLGSAVTVYRREAAGSDQHVDAFRALSALASHCREADALVSILPDAPGTRGIISRQILSSLKPTAFVVNLGRGSALDESALVEALRHKGIAGAALDVFASEPLPNDSPFWELENVLISPHVAGRFDRESQHHISQFLERLADLHQRMQEC